MKTWTKPTIKFVAETDMEDGGVNMTTYTWTADRLR